MRRYTWPIGAAALCKLRDARLTRHPYRHLYARAWEGHADPAACRYAYGSRHGARRRAFSPDDGDRRGGLWRGHQRARQAPGPGGAAGWTNRFTRVSCRNSMDPVQEPPSLEAYSHSVINEQENHQQIKSLESLPASDAMRNTVRGQFRAAPPGTTPLRRIDSGSFRGRRQRPFGSRSVLSFSRRVQPGRSRALQDRLKADAD